MIIDKLENISMYRVIPDHIVEFIKNLPKDIKPGRYDLLDKDFANIEEYTTKPLQNGKFEAHNNYIDIQILLSGREKIYYTQVSNLTVDVPYNPEKDIKFYSESIESFDSVTLDGHNFAMIFPHEAHAPQISVNDECIKVKKAVIKVRI